MNRDRLYVGFGGQWRPRVERLNLPAPSGLSGRKLLFVTDTHIGDGFAPRRQLRRLFAQIAALEADLILWGGDYAERGLCAEVLHEMRTLRPPLGQFGVIGNNDHPTYEKNPELFARARRESGFRLLVNETARIELPGCSIRLMGFDDARDGVPNPAILGGARRQAEYRILLSHSPLALHALADMGDENPDLILCGHTHGGQINLFGLNPYTFGYERAHSHNNFHITGQHPLNGGTLIVSNGIGASILPLRIGAPPQMHMITLA